jgi:hypothetical protein
MVGVVVVGGCLYPSTTKQPLGVATVDGRTGQSGAPPDIVQCASHVTQLLGIGAVDRWRLCLQAAPDSPVRHRTGPVYCPVRL